MRRAVPVSVTSEILALPARAARDCWRSVELEADDAASCVVARDADGEMTRVAARNSEIRRTPPSRSASRQRNAAGLISQVVSLMRGVIRGEARTCQAKKKVAKGGATVRYEYRSFSERTGGGWGEEWEVREAAANMGPRAGTRGAKEAKPRGLGMSS